MIFKSIFGFNSNSSLRMVTDSGFIIPFDSDIMSLLRELRRLLLHKGRTDRIFGHNDNENASGLGGYHFHHGEPPHLHPEGVCPYVTSDSLIRALRGYEAVQFLTKETVSDGKSIIVFEANIPFRNGEKLLSLEIGGPESGFCVYQDKKRYFKEKFFSKSLAPVLVRYDKSPWIGVSGGVDYNVNVDYLHGRIKEYTKERYIEGIEPMEVFARACTTDKETAEYEDFPMSKREANAKYIYQYLRYEGWSKQAICGMLGNAEQESYLNSGAWEYWNNPQRGYGIVQWTPNKETPEKFLQENRLSVERVNDMANGKIEGGQKLLMDMQLEYLLQELPYKGEWLPGMSLSHYKAIDLIDQSLKGMSFAEYKVSTASPIDLALVFHASYERSGDTHPDNAPDYKKLNNRITHAKKWETFFDRY